MTGNLIAFLPFASTRISVRRQVFPLLSTSQSCYLVPVYLWYQAFLHDTIFSTLFHVSVRPLARSDDDSSPRDGIRRIFGTVTSSLVMMLQI